MMNHKIYAREPDMNKREYKITQEGAQLHINDMPIGAAIKDLAIACSFDSEGALLHRHGSRQEVQAWIASQKSAPGVLQMQVIKVDHGAEAQRQINLVNTAFLGSASLESLFEGDAKDAMAQSDRESLSDARYREAKRCFENFDFELDVVGVDGWTYTAPGREMSCIVYLEDFVEPKEGESGFEDEQTQSIRVSFTVSFADFDSSEVSGVSALVMSTGGEIGHMPDRSTNTLQRPRK